MRRVPILALVLSVFVSSTALAQVVGVVEITSRHMVWDPVSQRLYASVQTPAAYSDSVAVIDPLSGTVERYIQVGATPNRLAVSDDGQFLYVALDGDHAICRVPLATFTVDQRIPLGASKDGTPYAALSVAVRPGAPRTIAVLLDRAGATWYADSLTIFDDGVPGRSAESQGAGRVLFSHDGSLIYGTYEEGGALVRWTLSDTALVCNDYAGMGRPGRGLFERDGLLYYGDGSVIDPQRRAVVGRFTPGSLLALDPAGDLAYRVDDFRNKLLAFDARTMRFAWAVDIPDIRVDLNSALFAWGHRQLALQHSGAVTFFDVAHRHRLTLSGGSADATIFSTPSGIDCGIAPWDPDCSTLFPEGSQVTLRTQVGSTTKFARWEGDPDCGDGVITMTSDITCRAVFESLSTGLGLALPMEATDVAYAEVTGKVYASVAGTDPIYGNTITEIDPDTGAIGRSVVVRSDPSMLRVAADGRRLYTLVNDQTALQWVDLTTMTAGSLQPFGVDQDLKRTRRATSYAIFPTDRDRVAVWHETRGASIYSAGLAEPSALDDLYQTVSFMAVSALGDRFYAASNSLLSRYTVTPTGVGAQEWGRPLSQVADFAADRIYTNDGRVLDAETLSLQARMSPVAGTLSRIFLDATRGVLYGQTWPQPTVNEPLFARYDAATGEFKDFRPGPPLVQGVSAGPNRLALLGQHSVVLFDYSEPLRHTLSLSSSVPGLTLTVSPPDVNGQSSGGTPFSLLYDRGTIVTVTAPASAEGTPFLVWLDQRNEELGRVNPLEWTAAAPLHATVVYRFPAPTIAKVSPSMGPPSGGTAITIKGANFRAPVSVKVGWVAATDVVLIDSSTITATVPAGATGSACVKVEIGDGQYVYGTFTYGPAAIMKSLLSTPDGPFKVGTPVTWTATAGEGLGPVYQFWLQDPAGKWSLLRDWDVWSKVTWTPPRVGLYAVEARVRSYASDAEYDSRLSTGRFSAVEEPQGGDPGDIPVPGDYDGDHLTDVAVFRPSTGYWYIMRSSFPTSRTGKLSIRWGLPTDVPVPGDYDGDGKADIGVWRPSTGHWYVLLSSRGYSMNNYLDVQWGYPTDRPMPGDYDGDGRTDIGVWRPSTGHWYVLLSSESYWPGSYLDVLWGYATDQPLLGDFDGDGRADIGVWRPSTGYWYVLWSSQQYRASTYLAAQWGFSTDVPQVGDFDGDGKADIAVWRPSTGYWYARLSGQGYATSSYLAKQWGLPTDLPVPGDYDGDGKTDFSVHRRSDATSYVLDSSHTYGYDFYRWIVCGSWLTGA